MEKIELTFHQRVVLAVLANPELCNGNAAPYDIKQWFGERGGVTRAEIAAMQAFHFADVVVETVEKGGKTK